MPDGESKIDIHLVCVCVCVIIYSWPVLSQRLLDGQVAAWTRLIEQHMPSRRN